MRGTASKPARWWRLPAAMLAMAAWCAAHAEGVSVSVLRFGAMRSFRPGDVTGVLVSLRSEEREPMECILQWELPNADGDTVVHTRRVTLAPGVAAQRWLYARLPPAARADDLSSEVFTLRLFEAGGEQRLRELATHRFRPGEVPDPPMPVEMDQGLIAVIGDAGMGLETLEATGGGETVPSMQELTRLVRGARVRDLPDRWEGLHALDTLVWTGDEGPQAASEEQRQALMDWVRRGGHLVVVLPETGDPWSAIGGGLGEMLPRQGVDRVEALPVAELLPVMTKGGSLRRPGAAIRATLFDPSRLDPAWRPMVSLAQRGRAVAVRRVVAHGFVSLVGVDVAALHRGALMEGGLPQADAFWNAVLGRRSDAPSDTDYRDWQETQPRQMANPTGAVRWEAGSGSMVQAALGGTVQVAVGVLLVMGFFVAYWVLAVPLPWLLLRRRGGLRWTWPAFTLVAVGAACVAWVAGWLVAGPRIRVRHVSVVDAVFERGTARPTDWRGMAWMSAALEGFGSSTLSLQGGEAGDMLMDWSPPPRGNAQRFPDLARGRRDVEKPWTIEVPSRGTQTDLQAWWTGAMPDGWGEGIWQDAPLTVTAQAGSRAGLRVSGSISHALPAPLQDVTLTLVTPFRYPQRSWGSGALPRIEPSGLPPRPARTGRVPTWDGKPLDVAAALGMKNGTAAVPGESEHDFTVQVDQLYGVPLRRAAGDPLGIQARAVGGLFREPQDNLAMLTLYQMLTPPTYRANPPADPEVARVTRLLGRELDLSAWFASPCLIVTGFLPDQVAPAPLRVDGRTPSSEGMVMVRCLIPLDVPDAGPVQPPSGRALP
jgi:hypothetical protein